MSLTTKQSISRAVARNTKRRAVFLRSDFEKYGSASRVTRALQDLQSEGKLIRIGYGVYTPARTSSITGARVPIKTLAELAQETLERLRADPRPGKAQQDYISGVSTQIPMGITFVTSKPVQRKLRLGGQEVIIEKARPRSN